ncbi:unnamed protein product [Allacma fusca]|uniref:Uncharacterized protein n=1 Tax=Allacma fusca TaxID=39272 RepID=A0A8J2P5I3_9HEXA|nr:unnamed protein product [Allacma fusca]
MGLYRGRVNCVLYENVQPLAESTPRSNEQKYCICRKRYYADEDSMIGCEPRQPLSISDIPFHLNEGNSSEEGGIKDQRNDFNYDGHLSMDHLDSASASLNQENIRVYSTTRD